MKSASVYYHRKSVRLKEYDYSSPGEYFVTICTNGWKCMFGEVVNEEMRLNEIGLIVQEEWLQTAKIRNNVEMDCYVVMPNHIHGIIILNNAGRGTSRRAPTKGK